MKILALVHPPARMGDSSLLLKRERDPYFSRAESNKVNSRWRSLRWRFQFEQCGEEGGWSLGGHGGWGQEQGWCMLPSCISGWDPHLPHTSQDPHGRGVLGEADSFSWFRTDRSMVTPAASLQELRGDPEDSSALERERVCLRSGDCTPGPRRSAALGWETW